MLLGKSNTCQRSQSPRRKDKALLKRIPKTSVRELLVSWSEGLKQQIEDELASAPAFMSIQTASRVMDVSESTIRRYISRGELTAITTEGPNSAQAAKA